MQTGVQTEVRPPTKFWVTSLLQGLALGVMHTLLIDGVGGSALVVSAGYVVAVLLVAGWPSPRRTTSTF